jgi:hypothetical protein
MINYKSLHLRCYSLNLYRVFKETFVSLKHMPLWNDLGTTRNLVPLDTGISGLCNRICTKHNARCCTAWRSMGFFRTFYQTSCFFIVQNFDMGQSYLHSSFWYRSLIFSICQVSCEQCSIVLIPYLI